jgi:glucokinase
MTKEAMDADKDSAMWTLFRERGDNKVSARIAYDAMRLGDKSATEVVDKFQRYLASGLTNVINIFQPEVLCIGGGVCNEGDALLNPVKELIAKEDYAKNSAKNTEVVIAKLGNDAGIIGAAFLGRANG